MRNITRIKLQLHLRITFISSTWSMYSYYNIYKKERGIFCANINQTSEQRCVSYFHRFHYFYRISISLITIILLISIGQTDNALHDWMIWFPLFKLRCKEYFYNFIILDLSINGIYIIYDKFAKLTSVVRLIFASFRPGINVDEGIVKSRV